MTNDLLTRSDWPKVCIIIVNYMNWRDTAECLETVFRNNYPNYQVVLVDLKLPGGDGRNVLKHMRDSKQGVHAILITGHPEELRAENSKSLTGEVDAVCLKPFDLRSLLDTIDQMAHSGNALE